MNMVMIVVEQLVERGSVERAFLGVALDSKYGPALAVSLGLSRPRGARVTRITPGSPAEKARLREGDVILRFNGVRIDNDSHLISLVSLTEVDSEVPLQIYRERQLIEVLVKLEKAPAKAVK
jgi:S1-C subfamily serine protease